MVQPLLELIVSCKDGLAQEYLLERMDWVAVGERGMWVEGVRGGLQARLAMLARALIGRRDLQAHHEGGVGPARHELPPLQMGDLCIAMEELLGELARRAVRVW